jgi:hypothetical protein
VFVATEGVMQAIFDGTLTLDDAFARKLIVLDAGAVDTGLLRAALDTAFPLERLQSVVS